MILSTVPLNRRGLVATPVALIAVLCVATRLPASEPSHGHQMPAGPLGYIHIQVSELDESPLFDTGRRLHSHVQAEASAFSLARLGLDATKLSEVSVLFPSFDVCMKLQGDRQSPFVLIATMSEAFQPERFADRLSAEWGLTRGTNNELTNRDDRAFFIASDHTVVIGSPASVDWWLSTRDDPDSGRLAASRAAMAGQGQVLAGFDATQVPQLLLSQLPAPIQTLSKASVATMEIRLDDGLGIKACLEFDDEGDAQHFSQELHALIEQGRTRLSDAATGMEVGLNNPNAPFGEGLGVLGALAFIREAGAHVDQVHIEHADGRVHAEARLDMSTTSLVVLGLTAIRSLGRDANAELESVVEQLDAQ